ncbi:hypothetical protein BD324DRAFT_620889 [Kockovaella imperatae]|uniref:Chromatin modification-related protein n=1 Tax=Kockovaella imperatae TaxID=4999 RepID=A0A1Y1UK65_9TREE|nr:hypothetical protein BD324DRAFT_620889 [Kockovaella imperatae]ORX38443.1 hypothetical protein BD324DRAFT_620889 [Kockovaella imperatae]
MPRKSLPAAASTPQRGPAPQRANTSVKRSTRQASPTPTRPKRRRRGQEHASDEEGEENSASVREVESEDAKPDANGKISLGPEKELEAWQDFAADHYEMIEQLPLELHRTFRLLRELDETCVAQTNDLETVIRRYIAKRMGIQAAERIELETNVPVIESAAPIPDGQGGLLAPPDGAEEGTEEALEVESRRAFPEEGKGQEGDVEMECDAVGQAKDPSADQGKDEEEGKTDTRASELLPDIGRLAREMVRNGEEKVALAVGAYNAIDRHIRALDSALSAHEASILLGLRPDTNPSAAVEPGMVLLDGIGKNPGEDREQVTIGMGGGTARKKKGKKNQATNGASDLPDATTELPGPLFDLEVDPNEPRYCYCNNVSYGQMVGCENDECPLEWFHLGCIGLTQPPTGKWWCNICKPKTDVDPGGGGGQKHKHKRGKGWSSRK